MKNSLHHAAGKKIEISRKNREKKDKRKKVSMRYIALGVSYKNVVKNAYIYRGKIQISDLENRNLKLLGIDTYF